MTRSLSVAVALALVFCCAPTAVVAQSESGLGAVIAGPVDLDALTGGVGHLGVQYAAQTANNFGAGSIIVSHRGFGATTVAPHTFYEFSVPAAGTSTATLIASSNQAPTANAAWGHRDMVVTELPGGFSTLIAGDENGIEAYDLMTLDGSGNYTNLTTAGSVIMLSTNGPIVNTVPWPLFTGGTAPNGNPRGLTWVPFTNSGNGSFFTANFGSAMTEFDIDGNVLNTYPSPGWSIYGIAYDAQTQMLWVNSSPNAGPLREVDPTTGLETGRFINRTGTGSAQGGLSIIPGSAIPGFNGVNALVGLDQATPDTFTIYRLNYYSTINGVDEVELLGEASTQGMPVVGNRVKADANFTMGSTLQFELFDPTGLRIPGSLPSVTLANLGPDATTNANTLGIPESVAPNAFSIPAAVSTIEIGNTILPGVPTGIPFGLGINFVGDTSIALPISFALTPGDQIRLQSFVIEPLAPNSVMATNTLRYTYQSPQNLCTPQGALVEAIGTNSFPGVAGAPYWNVTNTNPAGMGPNIVDVTFDMFNSSNPAWAASAGNFDYDQPMMAALETFQNGNSALGGTVCMGTYRAGSDVATGLVYDTANAYGVGTAGGPIACDPAALSGWATSNDLGGACTDVNFRFTAFTGGTAFQFDCDTDGGAGITGGTMAGIAVTILWDNGCTTSGELQADPANPNRAFINL